MKKFINDIKEKLKAFYLRHPKPIKTAAIATAAVVVIALGGRWTLRSQRLPIEEPVVVYIPTGSTFDDVVDTLNAHHCIVNEGLFRKASKARRYCSHVKSGRYQLEPKMSLVRTINKLYYGSQDPVRLTINKHRTRESLCQYLDSKLEFSGDSLLALLTDSATAAQYGHTTDNFWGMIVQNTYEVYWNVTPEKFVERMAKENDRFWTALRRSQCTDLGLTADEVVALASIVEEETNKSDEKPLVASVYLNRLHKGMLLQADPTVRYAHGDFTVKRIRGKMLENDSPYNTYKHTGLPPGPICLPSVSSIDAVLENHRSDYLYFCAKEDMSGYHNFASTLAEHQRNAAKYHRTLNQRKIQ